VLPDERAIEIDPLEDDILPSILIEGIVGPIDIREREVRSGSTNAGGFGAGREGGPEDQCAEGEAEEVRKFHGIYSFA